MSWFLVIAKGEIGIPPPVSPADDGREIIKIAVVSLLYKTCKSCLPFAYAGPHPPPRLL